MFMLAATTAFAQTTPTVVFDTPSPENEAETFCDELVARGLLPEGTEGYRIDAISPNPFPYGSAYGVTVFGQSTTINVSRTFAGDDTFLSFTSSNPDLGVDAVALWGNASGAVATAYVYDDELDGVAQSGDGLHNGGMAPEDAAPFYHARFCFAPAAPPPPPPCDGGGRCFETAQTNSVDNGDGTYTYTFETCKISSFCRGFSFVAIEIPAGASVLSASRSFESNSNGTFDPDYDFIKFQVGGSGNPGQCETITFTLDRPYTSDVINVRVKFGRTDASNKDKVDDYTVNLTECEAPARHETGTTSSARGSDNGTVELFALSAPYPNPVRSEATFHLRVDETTNVSIVVYDILGREVARLVDGVLEAGSYDVRWDAQSLPSGTYLARMRADGFTQTHTVSIAK